MTGSIHPRKKGTAADFIQAVLNWRTAFIEDREERIGPMVFGGTAHYLGIGPGMVRLVNSTGVDGQAAAGQDGEMTTETPVIISGYRLVGSGHAQDPEVGHCPCECHYHRTAEGKRGSCNYNGGCSGHHFAPAGNPGRPE